MPTAALVALGGAAGALIRYGIGLRVGGRAFPASSSPATATPTRVSRPRSAPGTAPSSSDRAVPRMAPVWAVGQGRVRDRAARDRSAKRSRSTTVRATRRAARSRRATRSARATSEASTTAGDRPLHPSARCDPMERRRRGRRARSGAGQEPPVEATARILFTASRAATLYASARVG